MKKRVLLLVILFLLAWGYEADATNYYIKPSGSDAATGMSTTLAWATLQHARAHGFSPGDTLFIMGGVYSTGQTFEVGYSAGPSITGSAEHPFVIKAYGDGVAEFQRMPSSPTDPYLRQTFRFYNNTGIISCTYIVIDGFGKLNGLPYQILIKPASDQAKTWAYGIAVTSNSATNTFNNFTIRGIEIDGSNPGVYFSSGLCLMFNKYADIDSCYIHHTSPPTGTIAPGDGTDNLQNSGMSAIFYSCQFVKIRNSIFKYSNHGLLEFQHYPSNDPTYPCKYFNITNNTLENHYGGGIYMYHGANHFLVDGNLFLHSGETTGYPKPAIQVNAGNNTFRRNVFYNPNNGSLSLNAQRQTTGDQSIIRHNLVYNNTFFGNANYGNLFLLVNNVSCDSCCVEYNGFYNNIFYKSRNYWTGGGGYTLYSEINMDFYNSNNLHNWITPDISTARPVSTAWGGNKFHNNLIRHDARGLAKDSLIVWGRPGTLGGYFAYYKGTAVNADGSGAWSNNIGGNPLLLSETPDSYPTTWWRLQEGSSAIDSGTVVVDYNGAEVTAIDPDYGWGDLTYYGAYPDIGAYEVSTALITSGTVSPSSMSFGTYVIGDTTAVDSFKIKNTGTDWLRGMVYGGDVNFKIISHENVVFSIAPDDSFWVRVRFTPTEGGLLSSHIHMGTSVLSNVTLTGGAVLMTPASIAFDDVKVGECDTSYIYLKNTGTGTVTGTVGGDSPDYDIFDGDGAFSLAAGEIDTVSVEFCPLTSGLKTFAVHLGSYFGVKDVSFVVNNSAIQVLFTTTETAGCLIWGGPYDADDPEGVTFTPWYHKATVHGVTHQHLISGLAASTKYAISIYANAASGESAWAPGTSSSHYYIVQTAASDNTGGGLIGTEW